jgi:hypothetical protein
METEQSDYLKYRGKCKEFCEALIEKDSSLKLVRGHYDCPIFGLQPHWWCLDTDGKVVDPTKNQFPSRGIGEYIEFDGNVECSQCGKQMKEEQAQYESNYVYCSTKCHMIFVGLGDFI